LKSGVLKSEKGECFEEYYWFDTTDYRSWSGIELAIYRTSKAKVVVSTRTTISRSYFDLVHQNNTISSLKKRFGGEFTTDEGRRRYLKPESGPPTAPASGCYLAFNCFGRNLIKASVCHHARDFPNYPHRKWKGIEFLQEMDPRTLANNTLVPFLVAAIEDYFKSTFIALLRYSIRKEVFLKGVRLQGDQLLAISNGKSTIEEQFSETLSFQKMSAICRHFEALDAKLDIAGTLRKPYRRRSQSLFESLEFLVRTRHDLIHRATLDPTMTDERVEVLIYDLDEAITRVYKHITEHYGWFYEKDWNLGRLRREKVSAPDAI
jgi:hypothetical protein